MNKNSPYYKRLHAWWGEEWFWNMLESVRLKSKYRLSSRAALIEHAVIELLKKNGDFDEYKKFLRRSNIPKKPRKYKSGSHPQCDN